MKIKQFEVPGLAQYSYIISSRGEAIVIDPMRDFDRYTTYAAEESLVIRYVTETHIHADLLPGPWHLLKPQARSLPSAPTTKSPTVTAWSNRALRDGDALWIGTLRLIARHTPGHTPST